LQFASRTYYAAKRRPPCARKIRDEALKPQISRVHTENLDVYGADEVWSQMKREGYPVARCTVVSKGTSHEVVGIEAVIPGGDHSAGTSSPGVASSSSRGG
jgi:hypothetical protein